MVSRYPRSFYYIPCITYDEDSFCESTVVAIT